MTAPNTLEQRLSEVIETLTDLDPAHKAFLRARWLDQVLFFEKAARRHVLGYFITRLTIIVGGVLLPTVTLTALGAPAGCVLSLPWAAVGCGVALDGLVVALGLAVALSAAVEQFFRYGEQWRHYRRMAEVFKSEAWEFFQLSGPYQGRTAQEAYPAFAARIEELSRQDVEAYFTKVLPTREEGQGQPAGAPSGARGAETRG